MDIKFRVWCKQQEEMMVVERLGFFEDGSFWYAEDKDRDLQPPYFCDDKDFELMQYTGFKDKDGKEIFQGDIVEYNFKSLKNDLNKTRISEVYLNEFRKSWSVYASVDNSSNNELFNYVRNGNVVKIIGNIYENPELLKRP